MVPSGSDDLGHPVRVRRPQPQNAKKSTRKRGNDYEYDLAGTCSRLTDHRNVTKYQYDELEPSHPGNHHRRGVFTHPTVRLRTQRNWSSSRSWRNRSSTTNDDADARSKNVGTTAATLSKHDHHRVYDIAMTVTAQVDDFSAYTYQFDALDRMTLRGRNFTVTATTPK